MFIQSIRIKGFRNFTDSTIEFNEGINVIIGHNNAGKSNLLRAISLVLGSATRRLEVEDFNKNIQLADLKKQPPKITIELKIVQSKGELFTSDDLVTVSNWLINLETPYTAQLTYEFFLPESENEDYIKKLEAVTEMKVAWNTIKHEFLRKFVSKLYGGKPELQSAADAESLSKFDYQFLDAIRDVERDMFTGKNTLLREIIDFFMDYEIKIDVAKEKDTKVAEIKAKKVAFSGEALELLSKLQQRMQHGQQQILQYAHDTGASFNNAKPDFDGTISESELYSALKLIIKYSTGIEIPATHNGLGYNNLIYMSLLLAKMQVDTNGDYLGSNAKVFPILVIEEPEAHLHPAMQYKFLKFLRGNLESKARQIFITTHSTQITSAVLLDEIISVGNKNGKMNIAYPGKVFDNTDEGKKSKAYVQRFLDATKSDMLFANSVILVEGTAEQLLLSSFAKYCASSHNLEDNHVAVINIGGRYFAHFLKLFDTSQPNTIDKKIACITDRDPMRKEKTSGDRFRSCYPFEVNSDTALYEYTEHAQPCIDQYNSHPNIRFFSQPQTTGKTLEYDLLMVNPDCELLLTSTISNKTELQELMKCLKEQKTLSQVKSENIMRASDENTRILQGVEHPNNSAMNDQEKIKAVIASRYLNSVGKGENALEIATLLEANLLKDPRTNFEVPDYIKQAITWVCQ
jgi:predicted ATP-dependent endonuclease of OLD family